MEPTNIPNQNQTLPEPERVDSQPIDQAMPHPLSQNVPVPGTVPVPQTAPTQQLIADDVDLIEKEWVMKAKAIVAHTKHDPYLQNIEMNKVKADYLKKRYNKDLKISEG